MARAPKKPENELLAALKFMALAQRPIGSEMQMHFRINNGTMTAHDHIMTVGQLLPVELPDCCPNTFQFIHAVERAKDASSVIIEDRAITVKTAKFKAVVPTLDGHSLQFIQPDAPSWPLNDDFRTAAQKATAFTKEGAQTVMGSSVMTRNGTIVGTNGTCLVEAWHGIPTPPGVILPKSFIDVLGKIKRPISNFGFSDLSFTVWFNDQSWAKTQIYKEEWPNVDGVLMYADNAVPQEIPKDFWAALEAVSPFSVDKRVYFGENLLRSHMSPDLGATHRVTGLLEGQSFNCGYLAAFEKLMDKADFTGNDRAAIFFGDKVRGLIAKSR